MKFLYLLLPAGVALLFLKGSSDLQSSQPPPPSSIPPDLSPRDRVVAAARGELGNLDPQKYWADVLPGVNVGKADWCGAFALWSLHQAGLDLDVDWRIGSGFLLVGKHKLPITHDPKPGDIAYFNHNEHEAVVSSVEPGSIGLINGNGTRGAVSESTILPSQATAFFSIEPLLSQAVA